MLAFQKGERDSALQRLDHRPGRRPAVSPAVLAVEPSKQREARRHHDRLREQLSARVHALLRLGGELQRQADRSHRRVARARVLVVAAAAADENPAVIDSRCSAWISDAPHPRVRSAACAACAAPAAAIRTTRERTPAVLRRAEAAGGKDYGSECERSEPKQTVRLRHHEIPFRHGCVRLPRTLQDHAAAPGSCGRCHAEPVRDPVGSSRRAPDPDGGRRRRRRHTGHHKGSDGVIPVGVSL